MIDILIIMAVMSGLLFVSLPLSIGCILFLITGGKKSDFK